VFDTVSAERFELKNIVAKRMPPTAAGLSGFVTKRRSNEKRATTRRAQCEVERYCNNLHLDLRLGLTAGHLAGHQ
jgi:hypothetical protein